MSPRLVVDSGVAVKWFVTEPNSTEARRLLDEYQGGRLDLVAPDLIFAEVGNIAWKLHVHRGMDAADARDIVDRFRALDIETIPAKELLDEAFPLAIQHRRTVYDALYLALSVREGCALVTADEKLYNAVNMSIPNVVLLADRT